MSEISRVSLFGKLNPLVYKTIEGATVFCKLRGNPYVELVHWMTQLLENNASDVHAVVRHYALDAAAHGARRDCGARPPAARLDGALGFLRAHPRCDRARLGLRLAAVRRRGRAQRLPPARHAEDAAPAQRPARHLQGVRQAQGRRVRRRPGIDRRQDRRAGPGAAGRQRSLRRPAGRGLRGDGAGGHGQAGGDQEVHDRPDRQGGEGRDGPGDRPRRRDPPDRRHPDAPAPEQPDPDRRGRRRQDRGGRGLRPAPRARRRAAAAPGRVAALARPRPARRPAHR